MSFYLYILQCSDGSYYTGHTDDLEKRIVAHQGSAISGYTSVRRPVQLVFVQGFSSREEAFQAERQVKGWTRGKKEALIQQNWGRLQELAEASNSFRSYGSTSSP